MQNDRPATALTPAPEIFAQKGKGVIESAVLTKGMKFHIYERTEYPPEGGIYIYYRGLPYPKKGFPYPEAIHANDIAKRTVLTILSMFGIRDMLLPALTLAILPFKKKVRILEYFIGGLNRIMSWTLDGHVLTEERYCNLCKELGKGIDAFFNGLGVDHRYATAFALYIKTMIEYDDAYRYRIEDIMSETTAEKLIENPRKEVRRLLNIFLSREKTHAKNTARILLQISSIVLLYPKIKKSFIKAVGKMNVVKMGLDNADRYHVLQRDEYNFTGRTFEERCEIMRQFHKEKNIPFAPMIEIVD